MNQSTGVFEQQQPAILNAQAASIVPPSDEDHVSTAADFGGFEPFVDEIVIARFLQLTRRSVLEMARANEIPAHPVGRGPRKTWRFRISEVAAKFSLDSKKRGGNLASAVPGATRRQ